MNEYTAVWVKRPTHNKIKVEAAKADMTFDEYLNHLMTQ